MHFDGDDILPVAVSIGKHFLFGFQHDGALIVRVIFIPFRQKLQGIVGIADGFHAHGNVAEVFLQIDLDMDFGTQGKLQGVDMLQQLSGCLCLLLGYPQL